MPSMKFAQSIDQALSHCKPSPPIVHSSNSSFGRLLEPVFQRFLKSHVARTALKEREGRMTFVVRESVGQQRHAERVEHFDALHIDAPADGGLNIEGNEIEIVVSLQRVAIKLDVAFDLKMLAGIEQRPRRRGKTHAANIEIGEARAALIEDVVNPGKLALAGARVAFA